MDISIIVGTVSFGPRIKADKNNGDILEFGMLATKDGRKEKDLSKVNKYLVQARGDMAKLAPYIKPKLKLLVVGTHLSKAYLDKQGQPQTAGTVNAFAIEFVGGREDSEAVGIGIVKETGFDVKNDVLPKAVEGFTGIEGIDY